jgi:hypothetical protein
MKETLCANGQAKKGEMRQKSQCCKELWGEEAKCRITGFGRQARIAG